MKELLPKIGLALGSGGPRGLSHIGVIKALEKENISIDFIAGCSIGAMVGGFYALTKDIAWVEKIAMETDWRRIVSLLAEPSLLSGGLAGGEKMEKFFLKQVGGKKFRDLKVPFTAVATDINTGKEVGITEGDLAIALRASSSVPLIFKPTKRKGKLLVDGGLSNPVPCDVVRRMGAEVVIAVNLDAYSFQNGRRASVINGGKLAIHRVALNSLNILRHHLSQYCVAEADFVIIPKVGEKSWTRFANGQGIIKKGEEETQLSISKIKDLIQSKSKESSD
jgi:NTE family protein